MFERGLGHSRNSISLTRLWANTPWPHQLRAPACPRRRVRFHAQSRLRWEIRPSHPERHLTASTNPLARSNSAHLAEGLPVRGMTTLATPMPVRSASIVESQ